jgi:hypothetical protein
MDQISRKTAEVAALPWKLNLQFFAEEGEYPSLEESPEFRDDAREFNAKMDKFVQERTKEPAQEPEKPETKPDNEPAKATEQAEPPEVAVPDQKPKQDSETNKAFQEMRKAREEAERLAKESEERAKRADALIAKQYGHMGITTVEQYESALQAEQEAETMKRYEEAGLTPEEIEKLKKFDQLQQETEQQKQVREQQENVSRWKQLYDAYPELYETAPLFNEGKEPEWYSAEMKAEIARGASPLAAYRNAHFETILQKRLASTKEEARQDALDKLNSKSHLAPNAVTGGDVEHVEIDEETMRMYRALNKGKTDAQIRAWHKKHAMGG